MTRETKIGLFVGMGVIILIGILISDHLSDLQKQSPAPLADAGAQIQPELASRTGAGAPPPLDPAMATRTEPASTRDIVAPAPQPKLQAGVTPPAPLPPVAEGPATLGIGLKPATSGRANVDTGALTANAHEDAPRQVVHFIKPGDTLSAISQQYFGDRAHAMAIYEANKDKMSSPRALRPGVRLVIPVKDKNDAKAADAASGVTTAAAAETAGAGSEKLALVDYKIQEGDTLAALAQKFYGSRGAWQKLYALNKDRVPNPNRMKPGTVIQVPAHH